MVLDVVELLQHETRYDEFIVFSADADFTPVLRKLRRYDRRTTVLAIGFPSAAYQASADLLIDERIFVREALGLGRSASEAVAPGNGAATDAVDAQPSEGRPSAAKTHPAAPAATSAVKAEPGTEKQPRSATPEELSAVVNRIWLAVEESPQPVSAGLLASRLKQEFPDITESWNGAGTFKQFFRSLGLSRLAWLSGSGGRVLDPSRHDVDASALVVEPDSPWAGDEQMFTVVREVCALTGAPMLAPKELQTVVRLLAEDVKEHSFELSSTARRVCVKCLETLGLRVRLRDVTFLLRGMQLNGHTFGQGDDGERTLASRLVNQVLFLCEREQMMLNEPAAAQIRSWIGGDPAKE
jgi:hypothetical protein